MTSFNELVDKLWNGSHEETTAALIATLGLDTFQSEVLYPMISAGVTFRARGQARNLERDVLSGAKPIPAERPRPSGTVHHPAEKSVRQKFMESMVAIDAFTYIPRGEMTLADYDARIAFLQSKSNGILESIKNEQTMKQFLVAHGVERFADLSQDVAIEIAA